MTRTAWDYTHLADAYLKRPQYAESAINALLRLAEVEPGVAVCDVGAGTAHLTLLLAARGLRVTAVEPNDAMRSNGIRRTAHLENVTWHDGTGEATGCPDHGFRLVTFGSSFNVTNRPLALQESVRILEPGGWFACMWNHRDLEDPIQARIESIIQERVAAYAYGTRREDQTEVIRASGLFGPVHALEGQVIHRQTPEDCIEAWRSHATLARQAGDDFASVVDAIAAYVNSLGSGPLEIPYTTRLWTAQVRP